MSEPLTYESDRLIHEWRERFTGRRTIAHEMLEQAEVLVRDAITRELEQTRAAAKTEREWDLERRERAVEHAAHRLRMGGAEDSTELRFKRDAIEACVPFAEFALTPAPPRAVSGLADLQDQLPEKVGGISVGTALRVGAGVALVLILLLVKLVIL